MGAKMSHMIGWNKVSPEKKYELVGTLIGLSMSMGFAFWAVQKLLKNMDPTAHDKREAKERAHDIITDMGIDVDGELTEYELCIASNIVDTRTLNVTWNDIGGLEDIIEELKENVILPFTRPELYAQSVLTQPPKGVLLHGPPGCGKTMIAKATAKATGARFINLQASSLFDKWYGESQKRAEAIFSLASRIQPTIIFIDEIDAFLRSRHDTDHESTALIKAQFMSLWDGLATDNGGRVMIMGATNRPMDVDPAFRRRMPCKFKINLPLKDSRAAILGVILQNEQVEEKGKVIDEVAAKANGYSGSDLMELCRVSAVCRIRDYLQQEAEESGDPSAVSLRPFHMADFKEGLRKMQNTSHEIRAVGLSLHDDGDVD